MLLFDPLFWIIVGPAFLVAMWAQVRVKSTFARYSKVAARSGMSGASAARAILRGAGLGVEVEPVGGQLTDHYDPRKRKLRLSEGVYGSNSLAALGVAAHEAGHAIQHSAGYAPMAIRSFFVPVVSIGSHAAMPLFFIGMFLSYARGQLPYGQLLMTIGIIVFAAVVVFQLVTLPVEINASRRAMALLTSQGIVGEDEAPAARKVLTAAALTYVAAALVAVMQLVYMILRSRR